MDASISTGIVIVLPCFNEAAVIAQSVARLRAWFPAASVLVVDDGSGDDTASRARAVAETDAGIQVHRLPVNGGKGHAVAAAAALVAGAAVVIADADLAYGEDSIRRAVDALERADIVIGNRRHRDSTYTVPVAAFGFLYRRHVLGIAFNWVVRAALGLHERDTQCGLKAFRGHAFQEVMTRLRTKGFAFDLDVLLLARALRFRIEEIPVEVRIDSGRSSVRLARDGAIALKEVATLALERLRGRYDPARIPPAGPR
jgi:dolichyl-phosphate beta-glucosyltransferase